MADDESVSTFCAITSATPQQAQTYLQFSDNNVEQAIELYFNSPDLAGAATTAATQGGSSSRQDPINVDDDDDESMGGTGGSGGGGAGGVGGGSGQGIEDDEAMARRLQSEMYGSGGGGGGAGMGDVDEEGVRAPMARTTETLVGPNSNWQDDPDEMRAAIAEQMLARQNRQTRNRAAPGIFNQREAPSIWNDGGNPSGSTADPAAARRAALSRATGGASESTSKSTLLAELFRPPFDLISPLPFSAARDEGKETQKWIIVNVQDPSIFDCQVLNRDIWKHPQIRETIQAHFLFLQYNKSDPRGQEYVNYYFAAMKDMEDAYPHIAIVDPRTGEQVKSWSGSPGPKASDFLMDLHEFLDRYSLDLAQKNPVQSVRKERKKEVGQMSEEEMLEMAMQNSLDPNRTSKLEEDDPDALTKGKGRAMDGPEVMDTTDLGPQANGETDPPAPVKAETPFSRISSTLLHEEPTSTDPKETTRIQFRYSGGRVVRRFNLSDPVRRLYEWLKAAPLEGKEGAAFELISMGKNLLEMLEMTVEEAGLKNGTVMVEFVDED